MNNKFIQYINKAKKITLPEEKQKAIRMRIQEFVEMTPIRTSAPQSIQSPFYFSKFKIFHLSKVVSFALIVLIAGGGTVSYASEDALPGDVFYTVKVNFKEPIQETLAFSPEAKLQVKTQQINTRLTESQILLQRNDMTPEKHQEVEIRVEKKIQEISTSIDKLQEKGDVETILEVTSVLEPVLKAHQDALKESSEKIEIEKVGEENIAILLAAEDVKKSVSETETVISESMTPIVETNNTERSGITTNLIATLERTLVEVEEKESKALESIDSKTQTSVDTQKLNEVSSKRVDEATQQINKIKETVAKENQTLQDKDVEFATIDTGIAVLDATIKNDQIVLSLTEAELLLVESKTLFESGMYKESLEKSQKAWKIITEIEIQKTIEQTKTMTPVETVKETVAEVEIVKPIETKQTEISPIETIPEKTPIEIRIEDQASQAIQALEDKLKTN